MTEPPPIRTVEPDEVLPPETPGEAPTPARSPLRPVLAGLVLDAVDLATFGPIGLVLGVPLGATAAWILTEPYGLSRRERIALSAGAGVYCAMPFTSVLPIGTALGFYLSRVRRA